MSAIQEEKKTDNELIAEFMGLPCDDDGSRLYSHTDWEGGEWGYGPDDLCYHKSWDWLMPVVEKIERLKVKVYQDAVVKDGTMADVQFKRGRNNSYVCIISYFEHDGGKHKHSRSYTGRIVVEAGTRILSVYKAVLAFIDWYNSQTIKK